MNHIIILTEQLEGGSREVSFKWGPSVYPVDLVSFLQICRSVYHTCL